MSNFDIYSPNSQFPLISIEHIGTRPEPIVPDGVWIEIQGTSLGNEAVINAINEEERVKTMLDSKREQLKKFQQDVHRRVALANQAHKEFLRDSQSVKMENERKLLLRSASAAELSTPKKNRCSYNNNPILICDGMSDTKYNDPSENIQNQSMGDPTLQISRNFNQVHPVDEARKHLAERTRSSFRLQKEKLQQFSASLPGGLWCTGPSRDRFEPPIDRDSLASTSSPSADDDQLETVPASSDSDDIVLASMQESITTSSSHRSSSTVNESSSENLVMNVKPNVHFKLSEESLKSDGSSNSKKKEKNLVSRSVPSNVGQSTRYCRDLTNSLNRGLCLNDVNTDGIKPQSIPPLVRPGAFAHNLKMADERAKWLSRRIFADAERERSKERARMREHLQRVARLKEEKEKERAEIEEKSREQIEAVERSKIQLQKESEMKIEQEKYKHEKETKKRQKTERFVAALHSQLRKRIALNKIELPPLCMCASSFWGTKPQTCANNCIFHHNQKAYAKALEAVLLIMERNIPSSHVDLQKSAVSLGLVVDNENDVDDEISSSDHVSSAESSQLLNESF